MENYEIQILQNYKSIDLQHVFDTGMREIHLDR